MSKARAKKLRKRARKVADSASPDVSSTGSEPSPWYTGNSEARSQNFNALRLELLGPFLFGQNSLCTQAVEKCKEQGVLEGRSTSLPVFFNREMWDTVRLVVAVVQTVLELFESNAQFSEYMLRVPSKTKQDDRSLAEVVRLHSDTLREVPSQRVRDVFTAIRSQVTDFAVRALTSDIGQVFSQTLEDKEKLVAPVKDRGNTNFKQLRFKAAIGDYTTAIKLCPYSPVLYCNRALCYLRNEENWCACLDSYRAIVLKPGWEKAYYRCSEAWSKLGEPRMALIINKEGIKECREVGDLSRQSADLLSTSASTKTKAGESSVRSEAKEHKKQTEDSSVGDSKGSNSCESRKESVEVKRRTKKSKKVSKPDVSSQDPPIIAFEALACPLIEGHLTCSELRRLCKEVEHKYCDPGLYFVRSHEWEKLESQPHTPPILNTDIDSIHEPMDAVFDEIWCPLVADSAEKKGIAPPQLCYFTEAEVVRKKLLPRDR